MRTKEHNETPALGCKIGKAYQILLGQLSTALKEFGLDITTSEYLILRAIYNKEGQQQCEIAEIVGKDKAAVCRSIAGLEKKGLVRTETVSHKCLRVYLTDISREIEPRIMEVAMMRHNALTDLVSKQEIEIFTHILDKIITSN